MKIFKKPDNKYPLWKYALIHALVYSSVASVFAIIFILILSVTPVHLKLEQDWIIFGVAIAITFLIIFIYVFVDEYYIDKKYHEELKMDKINEKIGDIDNIKSIDVQSLKTKKMSTKPQSNKIKTINQKSSSK